MQCLFYVVMIAAVTLAEPPPSKSYLPPSVSRNGYPQASQAEPTFSGAPQVIAARTLDQGARGRGNIISRSNSQEYEGRLGVGANQGYDENAAALGRSNVDGNSEPVHYNFEYVVNDINEGTDFGHREERLEDTAHGEYHVVLPDGRKQTVNYEADENGFKPQVSYHDTEELTSSIGYDVNAGARNHGNGYDGNAGIRNNGNGYDVNAGTRNNGNGYDVNGGVRTHGNGYDGNAGIRNNGNGYDVNAGKRNNGNGFKNAGRGNEQHGY